MKKNPFFIFCVTMLFLSFSYSHAQQPFSEASVLEWGKSYGIESLDSLRPIFLASGEKVFLARVETNEGRNFQSGVVLVDVENHKIQFAKELVGLDVEIQIQSLDHDAPTEIIFETLGSGQGEIHVSKILGYFDKSKKLKILFEKKYLMSNVDAVCGEDRAKNPDAYLAQFDCVEREVQWKFKDLNHDGILDLIQTEKTKTWHSKKSKTKMTKVEKFVFDSQDKTFIMVDVI